MAELLIRFRKPRAMTDAEARAWLARRAHARRAGTALTPGNEARLRLPLEPTARMSTEDRLLRYLMSDSA